ncbi:DUF5655 domain-containing protein [Methanococcus aeolicus]|uniref:DUF5655 domain-containing protein n=1 Tax=Methanococcus aeolicus TaxID=42879 RepID=UPI0021C59D4B|nr:DUF5655 domain-containing protein [Methanococcus aeolicus]UXM84524.1 DUF5655 domain-containing protein [Methanococcus aeolicus]
MILLKDGVEYIQCNYKYENELEKMVFEHHKEIFGDNTLLFNKSKIKTVANIGTIPDAFVVDLKNKNWYIVEVELKNHDVYGHVNSQIMKFLDAIDNPNTKKELSDKFYKEVINEPFKEALFKTNNIREVYKHISDIIDTNPSIVIIIDEITNKVESGLNLLSRYHDIKTIEFKTFKRKNSNCLDEHIHLFNRLYNIGENQQNVNKDNNNGDNTNTTKSNNYTEDDHLNGKPEYIINIYNELKKQILNIGDDITIKPLNQCIAYKVSNNSRNSRRTFVNVIVRNSKIRLDLCFGEDDYNNFKRDYLNWDMITWFDNYYYCGIDLKKNNELDNIMSLIEKCYEINKDS